MSASAAIYLVAHPHRVAPGDAGVIFHTFRGSGPGGQKKNKTSSAVRAVHEGTGIVAVCAEYREQGKNKEVALQRLRLALTLRCRNRVYLDRLSPPSEFDVDAGVKSAGYLLSVGFALDVLQAADWVVARAAERLGVTTGGLSRLLTSSPETMAEVNRRRAEVGLKGLRE